MKKNTLLTSSLIGLGALLPLTVQAQRTWNDSGEDASWSNAANWTGGVPESSTAVVIGNTATTNFIALDTGLPSNTIASLTFNAGIAPIEIVPAGVETFTVTGAITNLSNVRPKFSLAVSAGSSTTWTGPLEFASTVNVDANTITLAGDTIFSGGNLNFSITGASTFGRFIGAGTSSFNGVTINIGSTFNFSAGQTFDFTSGGFTGATIGALPALTGGLTWNTENFLSDGVISVIPEPSTWALMLGFAALGFTAVRRQRRQA